MPIISVMFNINIICYAIDATGIGNYTTASIKKDNKQRIINKRGHIAPIEVIASSTYKETIAMIHVDNNHFQYLNPT